MAETVWHEKGDSGRIEQAGVQYNGAALARLPGLRNGYVPQVGMDSWRCSLVKAIDMAFNPIDAGLLARCIKRDVLPGCGYRFFVVSDDNLIVKVSRRSFDDFYLKHKPSLQQFAGAIISVATVVYTLENRKPEQIIRIDYMRVKVDSDGALDQSQIDDSFRLVANRFGKLFGREPSVNNSGRVVNLIEKFDERRWTQLHPKLPGPAHKRILEMLFGRTTHAS